MLRSIATVFALAAALPALGESLNHTTGTEGLLLIDKLGGHVRFFDPTSLAERSNLELPKNPHDFALSADHRFAYVPIYGPGVYNRNPEPGHELYVLDLAERKVANVIDLSPYRSPHGVQIDARGMVYVTAELDRKILVVDGQAGRIVDTIDHEGSGHWLAVLPDGSKAYVANKDDKLFVSVLDLADAQAGRHRADAARHAGHHGVAGRQARHRDGPRAARDRRHRHGDRRGARPHRARRHDGRGLQGVLLARREVAADDGRARRSASSTPRTCARRSARSRSALHRWGSRFSADGKTALVANHGDGTVSAARHRDRDRHENVQGRNGNRDADVLLARTAYLCGFQTHLSDVSIKLSINRARAI